MQRLILIVGVYLAFAIVFLHCPAEVGTKASNPEWIRVSDDGTHFVGADLGRRIVLWGVNYDHDSRESRLLKDYWAIIDCSSGYVIAGSRIASHYNTLWKRRR